MTMARTPLYLSSALGLGLAFGGTAAGASVEDAILMPLPDVLVDMEARILPPGMEPESLGADDGMVDPGDGEDPGEVGGGDDSGGGGDEGGETCSECGYEGEEGYERPEAPPREPPENPENDNFPLGTGLTNTIVTALNLGGEACSRYNALDRIDCLRDELARAARQLPRTGDYAEMRRALETASAKLDQIVLQNVDRTAPVTRYRAPTSQGDRTSTTPIRRIAPQNAARANRQAVAVMDELQTTLLRSASSAARKQVHFERAAQAVDSMKVLLRST